MKTHKKKSGKGSQQRASKRSTKVKKAKEAGLGHAKKTKEEIKREFDEFTHKIARLESLRHELSLLDTQGFEREVASIKARLKDISALPQVEGAVKELREKIQQRHKEHEGTAPLKQKIRELQRMIEERRKLSTQRRLSRAEVEAVKNIPMLETELKELERKVELQRGEDARGRKLHAQLHAESEVLKKESRELKEESKEMKQAAGQMKRRITELERTLADKRRIFSKKQLSKQEVKYVHDIPTLEKELQQVRQAVEQHTKAARVKIDTGVGVLVDTKFDDFVNEIKAELTERLKAKESAMDAQLKVDVEEHEKIFANRYRELVNEFHEKYKDKVQHELGREVKAEFDEMLRQKLNAERKKIVEMLIKENQQKLNAERGQLGDEFETHYALKEKGLEKAFTQRVEALKSKTQRQLKARVDELQREHGERLQRELKQKEHALQAQLEQEYKQKLESEMKVRETLLEKKKAELERHVMEQARKILGSG